jgi:hypothetical protein
MASTASITFDGYFAVDLDDDPTNRLNRYFCVGLKETLRLGDWATHNVYVNDVDGLRVASVDEHGTMSCSQPSKELYRAVDRALAELRLSTTEAADALFAVGGADGLPGRPHAIGGTWMAPRCGRDPRVVFYIARNNTMDSTGRWRMFMCADVGTRELWSELCL